MKDNRELVIMNNTGRGKQRPAKESKLTGLAVSQIWYQLDYRASG